ncbi:MAG: TonB-dependent receptor [Deltaproteobacteria bacterium]|nr:TonB-dependent receptor [Deltaproteobacteria bacterium]MDD9826903.1 TonB-dependent receptor [Deltaproteobacteria bacterium]MDD9853904.1 TonB-dependent receptor [Deltaproteobacteria bacterium]MDD9872749.1 TonB-dependent receptor [Deltaproteobacteria bacterium]
MSKKAARCPERLRHWLAPLLTLALCAALPGAAWAQAEEDSPAGIEEIIVTATKREQSIQDVPIAVSAFAAEDLQARGISELEDLQQISPSISVYSSNSSSNGGTLRIRGMGTTGNNPGLESAVGSFVDGVYRSRSGQVYSDFVDLERIEILRGPQGTLFGKNTSAGAVQLITKQPEFEQGGSFAAEFGNYDHFKVHGGVTGPISDDLAFRFSGAWFNREGYYENVESGDAYDNRDRYSMRGQLLWKPSENAEFRIIGDFNKKDESCCPAAFHALGPSAGIVRLLGGYTPGQVGSIAAHSRTTSLPTPYSGAAPPYSGSNPVLAPYAPGVINLMNPQVSHFEAQSRKVSLNYEPVEDVEDYGLQVEANWEVRGATVTSITAYREFDAFRSQDIDFTNARILRPQNGNDNFETLSQELRVTGTTGPMDWLVGVYGYYEDISTSEEIRFDADAGRFFAYAFGYSPDDNTVLVAGPPQFTSAQLFGALSSLLPDGGGYGAVWGQETTGFALFTNNVYHASDQLDVTVGLRYSSETKDAFGSINGGRPGQVVNEAWCNNIPGAFLSVRIVVSSLCDNASWANSESETEWTGTLSASYSITDDLNSYLSYSRGYKAGGYNLDQESYDSVICWAYGAPFNALTRARTQDPAFLLALAAAGQTPPVLTPSSGGSRFEVVDNDGNPATNPCEGKSNGEEAFQVDNTRFDPEFADSLEAGLKGTYLGGALTINSALFWTQYEDFQLNTFNGLGFVISNVSEVDSWGVEVEAFWNIMEGLFATFGVTYADTTYGDDARDGQGRPLTNLLDAPTGGNVDQRVSAQGKRITHAPAWQGSASIYYEAPVTRTGWLGFFSGNLSYRGRHNTGSNLHPIKVENSYALLNAQAGLRSPDGLWEAVLWGNNLRNKFVNTLIFDSVFQSGSFHTFVNQPRMWGVTIRYRFGADAL